MATEQTKPRRTALLVATALIVPALAIAELVKGGMDDEVGTEDLIGFVVFTVIAIAVAAMLLLRVLPAAERKPDGKSRLTRMGLVLGVLGLLSVVAYWSGLPFALGVAAAVAGRDSGGRIDEVSRATAAIALGGLAVLGGVVAAIAG